MTPLKNDRELGEFDQRLYHLEAEIAQLRQWRYDLPHELIIPIRQEIAELKTLIKKSPVSDKSVGKYLTKENVLFFATGSGLMYTILQAAHLIK
jgi:hypothetical protein